MKKIMIDRHRVVSTGLVLQVKEVRLVRHDDDGPAWSQEQPSFPDGTKVEFDYEQAVETVEAPIPDAFEPLAEDPE